MMLPNRLGLETARIPHADRRGLVWLSRGHLSVVNGTLCFRTAGGRDLEPGVYAIQFQMVSILLLGPGGTESHDVLRPCTRHGICLIAVGEDGVRACTAPPLAPGHCAAARLQAKLWADSAKRLALARHMYARRLGEVLPNRKLAALRGIEGARKRALYPTIAQQHGAMWKGRRYDRANPDAADLRNHAINHDRDRTGGLLSTRHVFVRPRACVGRADRLAVSLRPGIGRHDLGCTKHAAAPGRVAAGRALKEFGRVRRTIHCQARAVALKIFAFCLEFPRRSGDGPARRSWTDNRVGFAPQVRGWTDNAPCFRMLVFTFPAGAGIDPLPTYRWSGRRRFPRMCGDGPLPSARIFGVVIPQAVDNAHYHRFFLRSLTR